MARGATYSAYDPFADTYNRHWGSSFVGSTLAALDRLVLPDLGKGAHILDICCGTGQVAAALTRRGYRVTGLDGSAAMIRFARRNAPRAKFLVADARRFRLPAIYGAAISVYDSLNHILTIRELRSAFRSVYESLRAGAPFLFDLNMEAGFRRRWRGSFSIIGKEEVVAVRTGYDAETRLGRFDVAIFRRDKGWRRADVTLVERCYRAPEIRTALRSVGFRDIRRYDAPEVTRSREVGRSFFVCRKP